METGFGIYFHDHVKIYRRFLDILKRLSSESHFDGTLFLFCRTEEEEERDLRRFHSVKVLRKKTELIPSLLKDEDEEKEEKPTDGEKVETEEDKEKRLSK